ncbi:MAG: PilZ domain-containing protein [Pyrinomonadaceae bacterium]|nr:PilZ domain-containing protein [Pyrinomonadaceae bacterium]
MDKERRSDERLPTNLPAKWDGLSGGHEARIEDISIGGCFVNTTGRVDIGEVVVLQAKLPSGEWLTLRGEATSFQEGVGFGLIFSFITDEEESALREFISNRPSY